MKRALSAVALFLAASIAYGAQETVPSDITCDDLPDRYQLTADGRERMKNLIGSCEGVVEIDGELYATTTAVVRSAGSRTVRLYLPATDRTFEVTPDPELRVSIQGRSYRPRDLSRGQEMNVHVAVSKVAEARTLDTITVPLADSTESTELAVVETQALPTTAGLLPALALMSLVLLLMGGAIRRFRQV